MRRSSSPSRRLPALLTSLAATVAASAGLLAGGAGTAAAAEHVNPVPAHVYSPYFEAYNGDDPAALAKASGVHYETLAFLGTDAPGSCTAYWNNDTTTPIGSPAYRRAAATIQRGGGQVIPSFGGYGADTTGTDIADSCTDVHAIAKVFEDVLTTYRTGRIDLDVEADSLNDTAAVTRRNQAVAEVQAWARRTGRQAEFVYTLPTTTTGLGATGVALLQDAVRQHARIDVVNAMAFDYWDGATHEMGTAAETAASGVYDQLHALLPNRSSRELWGSIGITLMPGIDDYGPEETTTLADVRTFETWASRHGLAEVSVWALQRDNGGCPGTKGAGTCSGIDQPEWAASHILEHFTSGGRDSGPGRH
ncbi:chitinase [Streptomyces sp. NPDC090306]|uniref:chitinase n=1 Tax=unclassified Streptomyces TaxID=2593676 RepID=UPI0036ED85A6